MNAQEDLKELITYKPDIVGDFPEKIFPIEERLKLNSGAGHVREKMICQWTRIISTKNGSHKISFESGNFVHFPEEDKTIEVENNEWQNIRYKIDPATKEIEVRDFYHYPIKLAWAITV
jgi:hypothetical protein